MSEQRVPSAEYELTPEDWEEVNAVHLFDSPLYKEMTSRGRIIGGLLFATLSALMLLMGWTGGAIMFALGIPISIASMGPMQRKAQRQSLKKLGEQGVSNGLFGHHRVEVREEGLFHRTHAFDTLIRWHAIEDVREKSGHFFVYTGPNAFLPIPVTAFPDSQSLRAFSDAFHERIAAHERLPPPSPATHAG